MRFILGMGDIDILYKCVCSTLLRDEGVRQTTRVRVTTIANYMILHGYC